MDKATAIQLAINHPDSLALLIDYASNAAHPNLISRRIVSPVKQLPGGDTLALCLSRGDYRRFKTGQISRFKLLDANTVIAPAVFAEIDLSISDPSPADCRP